MRTEVYNGYNEQDDLYLCFCGHEQCRKNFICKPHIRECYLIHYVTEGECVLKIEEQSFLAKKGDAFIIPPGKLVSYWQNKEPLCYYWFAYNGKAADELFAQQLPRPVVTLSPENNVVSLVKDCINELVTPNPNQMKLKGYLYLLLSQLTGQEEKPASLGKEEARNVHVEKAMSYIQHNYMKNITISEISEYLGLERTYFSKLFKRKTGITPIEYLNQCQMEKAMDFMENSDFSFQEISELIGVCDQYYFTKFVKERTGMTPSEYRKYCKENKIAQMK